MKISLVKMRSETLFLSLLLLVALSAVEAGEWQYLDGHFDSSPAYNTAYTACNIMKRGVTNGEKQNILQLHNEYRSKVATGRETRAGGLPSAADMLEMVWDEELAAMAQKHAETCNFAHDKSNRRVKGFSVGQNIGIMSTTGTPPSSANWNAFLEDMYNEVRNFNKHYINQYRGGPHGKQQYGHFTQMIWANSWRVGCGWILFKDGGFTKSYTVCNYGPGGNVITGQVYKAGPACSACPRNSCCGGHCMKRSITPGYPGLCKIM